MAKPALSPEDEMLHSRLCRAIDADRVTVFLDAHRLNRPGSPVFNPWDSLGPLIAVLCLCMVLLLFGGLEWGLFGMVGVVAAQLWGIKHWIGWQLRRRALKALQKNVHVWNLIWRFGGVAVALTESPQINCIAPNGNWRNFVELYLGSSDQAVVET
ncbi:MAG: hypothetical protein K2Q10_12765 [Rhodospirillales bacterium]|nr:hypothetical protein [Rhodospirillales bacterium]